MEAIYGKNNKEELPLEFYVKRFQAGDPAEMAARCALPWDEETKTIAMTLLGEPFTVSHPDFTVAGPRALSNPERILLLRYLLDGRCAMPTGQYLTYRSSPGGRSTSSSSPAGASSASPSPTAGNRAAAGRYGEDARRGPGPERCGLPGGADAGLTVQFLLWLGDEEFPPSGQILFSDNFRFAFTARTWPTSGTSS